MMDEGKDSTQLTEHIDHCWINDVDAVVKHGHDEGQYEWDGGLSAFVRLEDSRRVESAHQK